jgi:hypothetical protein
MVPSQDHGTGIRSFFSRWACSHRVRQTSWLASAEPRGSAMNGSRRAWCGPGIGLGFISPRNASPPLARAPKGDETAAALVSACSPWDESSAHRESPSPEQVIGYGGCSGIREAKVRHLPGEQVREPGGIGRGPGRDRANSGSPRSRRPPALTSPGTPALCGKARETALAEEGASGWERTILATAGRPIEWKLVLQREIAGLGRGRPADPGRAEKVRVASTVDRDAVELQLISAQDLHAKASALGTRLDLALQIVCRRTIQALKLGRDSLEVQDGSLTDCSLADDVPVELNGIVHKGGQLPDAQVKVGHPIGLRGLAVPHPMWWEPLRLLGEGADRALGLFINTLPARILVGKEGVEASVRATHTQLADLLRHEHASLALAQRCSAVAAPAPLFSALLNYRHSTSMTQAASAEAMQAWEGIQRLYAEERTNYPFTLSVSDLGEGFMERAYGKAFLTGYLQKLIETPKPLWSLFWLLGSTPNKLLDRKSVV